MNKHFLKELDLKVSLDLIHKVCGILDVNSLDIKISEMELSAIYPTVSILEHNCLPNVSFSYDKFGHINVYTARKIAK